MKLFPHRFQLWQVVVNLNNGLICETCQVFNMMCGGSFVDVEPIEAMNVSILHHINYIMALVRKNTMILISKNNVNSS